MFEVQCGNIFITEHGDFSLLCVNCGVIFWEFNEYRNHILENHLAEYFDHKPDSKSYINLDIDEIDNTDNSPPIKRIKVERNNISEILTIEKLRDEELNVENQSDYEERCIEFDDGDKSNYQDSETSEIKVVIASDDDDFEELIFCKICEENFENLEIFNNHKQNCKAIFCPVCSMQLYGEDIKNHIDTCRLNSKKKTSKKKTKTSASTSASKTLTKSNAQKSICKYCDRVFFVENAFRKHMIIHEANLDKCEFCGKRFRTLDLLKMHIRRHKGEKPFKCSICPSAFNDKINLKTHYIVKHTEGLKIPCEHEGCGRIFKTMELKKRHERYVHNSESNYLCLSCGMRFKTSSKLNEHTKKKHLDYKDRPFECEYCKKKFIFLQDLKNHKMTHTGEKPFKCELCPKAFIKKYELTKHLRKKHPIPNIKESTD